MRLPKLLLYGLCSPTRTRDRGAPKEGAVPLKDRVGVTRQKNGQSRPCARHESKMTAEKAKTWFLTLAPYVRTESLLRHANA
jgi:hypothetical protein